MQTEHYHLVFLLINVAEVLLEPFVLCRGKASVVIPGRSVWTGVGDRGCADDVIHHNDVHISSVERIVRRTEVLEIQGGRFEIRCGRGRVVVIAYALEERQVSASVFEVRHRRLHRFPKVRAVESDVSQGECVWIRIFVRIVRKRVLNVGDGFVLVPEYLGCRLTLRVTDHHEGYFVFRCSTRRENEVVAVLICSDYGSRREEARKVILLIQRNVIAGRNRDVCLAGIAACSHLINTVFVSLNEGISVSNGNSRDRIAVDVLDYAYQIAVLTYRGPVQFRQPFAVTFVLSSIVRYLFTSNPHEEGCREQ